MSIEVRNIRKQFGSFVAVDDVSLHVASGELLALLGPSGSGKTTLLRMIAGLEFPDSGSILLHSEDATLHGPSRRRVGFVFQHYALFRHMTIFENVAFGLRVQPRKSRLPKNEIRDRVLHLLELVQLERLANHYPSQLSGGQRQRGGIARADVGGPSFGLADEPAGNLDSSTGASIRALIRELNAAGSTIVMITHDAGLADQLPRQIRLLDGQMVSDTGRYRGVLVAPLDMAPMDVPRAKAAMPCVPRADDSG